MTSPGHPVPQSVTLTLAARPSAGCSARGPPGARWGPHGWDEGSADLVSTAGRTLYPRRPPTPTPRSPGFQPDRSHAHQAKLALLCKSTSIGSWTWIVKGSC